MSVSFSNRFDLPGVPAWRRYGECIPVIGTGQLRRLRWLSQTSRTTGHIDQTRYGEVAKTQAAKPDQGLPGANSRILIFLLEEAGLTEGAPGPVKVERCTDLLAQLR